MDSSPHQGGQRHPPISVRLHRSIAFWTLCALTGCAPASLEEYRNEGKTLSQKLTMELQQIRSREDLLGAEARLKQRFEEIVDLILAAKTFQRLHSDQIMGTYDEGVLGASEALMFEIQRIYALEGGKEIVEHAQREALFRLDAGLQAVTPVAYKSSSAHPLLPTR